LLRLINRLPSSFRIVFVMRYLHEWSTEETANTLGITVAATKTRLLRARRHLQQQLGKRHERVDKTEIP
jgi:RNA polymerase sigma-70 factor (ECF subfamily)